LLEVVEKLPENIRGPFFLVQRLPPIPGEGSNIIVISSIGSHTAIGKPGVDNSLNPYPRLDQTKVRPQSLRLKRARLLQGGAIKTEHC
jgi:hypothetical protein